MSVKKRIYLSIAIAVLITIITLFYFFLSPLDKKMEELQGISLIKNIYQFEQPWTVVDGPKTIKDTPFGIISIKGSQQPISDDIIKRCAIIVLTDMIKPYDKVRLTKIQFKEVSGYDPVCFIPLATKIGE